MCATNDSSGLQSRTERVFRDPIYRRKRYDTNCRYVTKHRDNKFSNFSIIELIPLAFYTLSTDLENSQDVKLASQVATKRYESDKCDLFDDWHKFCKVLNPEQRAVAIFEGSIFFASRLILESDDRNVWLSECQKQFQALRSLAKNNVQDACKHKRKRNQVETSTEDNVYIARMAAIDKVKATIGVYLFVSMKTSIARKQEEEKGMISLTDTVRLYFATQEGEDFKLTMWICSSAGDSISKANARSVNKLRDMLGNYLFKAMEASNKRVREQGAICTGAVAVFPGGKDRDSKLEVTLSFTVGKDIYATMYSS